MTSQQLGRYHLVSELGTGAMGVVYRATDPLIERTVAIKTINLSLSKDEAEEFERRFYSEAKSAGRLNHPNIVTVYDIGHTDSLAYIAMEYLEGQSLRAILDSGIVLPFDKVIDIVAQVADGLACAHDNQIVHRDIKPANIMVLKNGLVKITDFGVALIPSGSRTTTGMTMGSPAYMSPEQVVSGKVDGRSDIYSLGVVLYEMLTGRVPFSGENVSAVMYRVLHDVAAAPSSINGNIPPSLDAVVLKALAREPQERYQSAGELAEDIRRLREELSSGIGSEPVANSVAPSADIQDDTAVMLGLPEIPVAATTTPREENNHDVVLGLPEIPLIGAGDAAEESRGVRASSNKRRLGYAGAVLGIVAVALFGLFRMSGPTATHNGGEAQMGAERQTSQIAAPVDVPKPVVPQEAAPKQPTESTVPVASAKKSEPAKQDGPAPPALRKEADRLPVSPAPASAYLVFSVSPWGEIFVDGKKRGVSPPLTKLAVTPGKHTIEVKNPSMAAYKQEVDLAPKASARIKHKFN